MHTKEIGARFVDSAIQVQSALDPGLLATKLSVCKLRFLFNFNVLHLKGGINRVVNRL